MASSSISGRSPTSSISMDSSEPIPAWFEPDGCGCSGSRAHVVVSALLLVSFFIGFSFLFSFESIAWPSGPRITNADETQAVLFDSQLRQRRRTKLVLPVFISQAAASASRVTNPSACERCRWQIHPRRSAITGLGTSSRIQPWVSGTSLVMSPATHA